VGAVKGSSAVSESTLCFILARVLLVASAAGGTRQGRHRTYRLTWTSIGCGRPPCGSADEMHDVAMQRH
jgi:hypothetical protein